MKEFILLMMLSVILMAIVVYGVLVLVLFAGLICDVLKKEFKS